MTPSSSSEVGNKNGLLLYFHDYSFYSQKVLMALHEKKLPYKTHLIDISKGEQYQPWFLEINPRGEIPVLKDGVKIIPDSARIIDYLEDNFSNGDTPRLIPISQGLEVKQRIEYFRQLINKIPANVVTVGAFYHPDLIKNSGLPFIAPVRSLMKSEDMKMAAKLRSIAESNPRSRDALIQKANAQEKNQAMVSNREGYMKLLDEVEATLQEVEEELQSHKGSNKWLVTETFTVADIDLVILLERLSQVGLSHRFWGAGKRPSILSYFSRAQSRDSFKASIPNAFTHAKVLVGGRNIALGATAIVATIAGALYFSRRSSSN